MSSSSDVNHSCLFTTNVFHQRFLPAEHRLDYDTFMVWVDLDELPQLDNVFGMTVNRPGLLSFYESDHLPTSSNTPLRERVIDWMCANGMDVCPEARVCILTQLKTVGYTFNPAVIIAAFDCDNTPLGAILQVTNTFYEQKAFPVPWNTANQCFQAVLPKHFYVSPFLNLDDVFEIRFEPSENGFSLSVNTRRNNQIYLAATIQGRRIPLTSMNLIKQAIQHPLLPQATMVWIHWHAFRLWCKRIKYHRKQENQELQSGVL